MKLNFKVIQGPVRVNSIWIYRAERNVICLSVDFKQKYPDFFGYGDNNNIFRFGVGPETIGVKPSEKLSEIEILNLPSNWKVGRASVSIKKYSALITIVNVHKKPICVWWHKNS